MEYTLDEDKEEKDFFGGDSEYFRFDKKNSATVKKNEKNDVKLNEFKEDLEEIDMRSKSELNDDNKKSKIKFDEKKKENKIPIIFTGNKTIRIEADKENKKDKNNKKNKKNKKNEHKTNTEIDYQNTKQKMQFDLDLFNFCNSIEDNYIDLYGDQQDSDRFEKTFEDFDVRTNIQKKHPNTAINSINIIEELDMDIDSEGNI